MSNKKSYSSSEGIGRIWKTTLAKAVDPTAQRPRKDNYRSAPVKSIPRDDKHDDLDPFLLKALRKIGSGYENNVTDSQVPSSDQDANEYTTNSVDETSKNHQVEHGGDEPIPLLKVKVSLDCAKELRRRHSNGFYSAPHLRPNKKCERNRNVEKENVNHERVISKSKTSTRRSDTTHDDRHQESESWDTTPPRFRNRRSEDVFSKNTVAFREGLEKTVQLEDDERKVENLDAKLDSTQFDKGDCRETLKENSDLDAYDKWKMRRQNKSKGNGMTDERFAPSKICDEDQANPSKVLPSHKPTEYDSGYLATTSNTGHNSTEETCNTPKDDASKPTVEYAQCPPMAGGDSMENTSDDNDSSALLQTSAMDKIQNLFASYTSPIVSDRPLKRSTKEFVETPHENTNHSPSEETAGYHQSARRDDPASVDDEFYSQNIAPEEGTENHKRLEPNTIVDDKDSENYEEINGQMQDLNISDQYNKSDHQDPCNTSKSSYHSKFLTKSPASIPSGFSSDYDVGIVSQSDLEDEESPHPCAKKLFPSHSKHEHGNERHQSAGSHYQGYAGTPWNRPYLPSRYPRPYYHGHYPHPYPSGHFTGHTPHSSSSHGTSITVPAETFRNKESLEKVMDFVSAKTEEWNKFMSYHHGHTVPVDVVINVTLPGNKESPMPKEGPMPAGPYPAPGWQYPTYPSSMGYYPFWQHPYHNHMNSETMTHPGPQGPYQPHTVYDKEAQNTDNENESRENLKERLQQRVPHHYEQYSEEVNEAPETTNSEGVYGESRRTSRHPSGNSLHPEDEMKRSFSLEADSDSEAGQYKKATDVKSKKIRRSGDWDLASRPSETNSNDQSDSHRNSLRRNSISNFLNPNDLQNDWKTASKLSSTSKKHESYDQYPRESSPRGRDDKRQPETNSTRDRSGSFLRELNPISRSWAEECCDHGNDHEDSLSSSEQFAVSPASSEGCYNSFNRRRSDSIVSYSSEDRSPIAKDNRLCKTPGFHRDRKYAQSDSWKKSLISRSKTYSHQFIDTHCHIDFLYHRLNRRTIPFSQFVEEHSDSFPINFEGCVAVFCNPKVFSDRSQANHILKSLCKEDKVWAAVGCHPKNATDFFNHHISQLKNILHNHPKIVALGEIGLDYSGTFHQYADKQKKVFIQQLEVAIELKLPIVIHCRDADEDCLEIMKKHVPVNHKIHLHCFTRQISIARQYMEYFPNLFVGFTPLITYNSARHATRAAELVPLDRLLLETDSPYFVPTGVPLDDVKGVSHPGLALFTAERLAQLKGISVDTVLEACRKNTLAMYGI